MYVAAFKKRNLKPIVLIPYAPIPNFDKIVEGFEKSFPGEEVEVCQDADDAMAILEGKKIEAVFAGGDPGVGLADELSKRLGLPGNDPSTTWLRTTKLGMATALEKAGLRHMRTRSVKSEKEVKEFWETCNGKCAIKYTSSGASVGFKVCSSLDECINHFNLLRNSTNNIGEKDVDILMQEYVIGEEYVVNTASCNGKHVITDLWRYRLTNANGNVFYDGEMLLSESSAPRGLIDYALAVLDATGVRYGLCHSEYFWNSEGPILIETNPRMMGASQPEEFQIAMYGCTYADYSFATMDEEMFSDMLKVHFDTNGKYAIVEELTATKVGELDPAPTNILVSALPSYFSCDMKDGKRLISKTIDLSTSLGNLFLVAESKDILERDYKMIKELENNYPDLMMEDDSFKFAHTLADLKLTVDSISAGEVLDVDLSIAESIPYGKEGLSVAMSFFGMIECGSDRDKIQFCKESR